MPTSTKAEAVVKNIEKVIIGKRFQIELVIKAIIAGGHILLEDIPGTGKTSLARALAASINVSHKRIQFTPDLLPSDITGISIYNEKSRDFEFKKGPVFAQIVLADEINRASPKTQSAMLEVMEEQQLTESGETYTMAQPFAVIATQNPLEYEGTFRLPEAQLDRFLIRLSLGYPDRAHEERILASHASVKPLETISSVASPEDFIELQKQREKIIVSDKITFYIVSLAEETRKHQHISLGASTRASIALQRMAQASAVFSGRDFVTPEDVRSSIQYVFSHRIKLSSIARSNGITAEDVIAEIVQKTTVPGL